MITVSRAAPTAPSSAATIWDSRRRADQALPLARRVELPGGGRRVRVRVGGQEHGDGRVAVGLGVDARVARTDRGAHRHRRATRSIRPRPLGQVRVDEHGLERGFGHGARPAAQQAAARGRRVRRRLGVVLLADQVAVEVVEPVGASEGMRTATASATRSSWATTSRQSQQRSTWTLASSRSSGSACPSIPADSTRRACS
jgi:hypothetical protein